MEFLEAVTSSDLERFCSLSGPGVADAESVLRHQPDSSWLAAGSNGVEARCSLWWTNAPPLEDQTAGVIGHFAGEGEAAVGLLRHACGELARRGATIAIGPMDGNTWRRYRAVTEVGDRPPFFLEPVNPASWAEIFLAAGFTPLAEYCSARVDEIATSNPRAEAVWNRLSQRGLRIRSLDVSKVEEELERIYTLSLASFTRNFLYTPLAREEFFAQYGAIMRYVRPELVLMAERGEQAAGFLFAIPDHLESQRGSTYIVKTLAVDPAFAGLGIGSVLLWHANRAAYDLGYWSAIHALMHQDNQSIKISSREGRVFRGYTLFGRVLR